MSSTGSMVLLQSSLTSLTAYKCLMVACSFAWGEHSHCKAKIETTSLCPVYTGL